MTTACMLANNNQMLPVALFVLILGFVLDFGNILAHRTKRTQLLASFVLPALPAWAVILSHGPLDFAQLALILLSWLLVGGFVLSVAKICEEIVPRKS